MNKHSQEHLKTSKLGEDPLTFVTFNLKVFRSGLKLQFPVFILVPVVSARPLEAAVSLQWPEKQEEGSWSSSEARAAIPTSGRDATRSHRVPTDLIEKSPGRTGANRF